LDPQAVVAFVKAVLDQFWVLCGVPAFLGVLGLLVGSFLNVVIYRKPVIMMREWLLDTGGILGDGETWKQVFGRPQPAELTEAGHTIDKHLEGLAPLSLSRPRSRCGACGHQIRWYENIPLLSWLVLRARCSACKTPISVRYPLIEAVTGLLFAFASWKFGPHPLAFAWCIALALLVAMTMIDIDTQLLPDDLTYPLLWLGLGVSLAGWTIPLQDAVIGAIAGYLPLWLIAESYAWLRKRPGMGGGDLKLLAALGAWFGWQAILPIILISSIVGLCVNLPRRFLSGHDADHQYPFGPFLVGGGLVVFFVGNDSLLSWAGIRFPV
jgi:leader peptidase (prepilin peptidase)/N-methyltransferase